MNYYMGIDIGTYESKGVLVNASGEIVHACACPHEMSTPRPGWAEHDAEGVWWHDLCALSQALIRESGVDAERVAALGVSAIAPCCLPVDHDMRPLRPAILYGVDVRAKREIEELTRQIGPKAILEKCGSPVTSQSAAAKILWIKRNEPEIYAAASKFVTASTYLVAKLTDQCVIDHYTAAAWVPLYDVRALDWSEDLCGACRRDQLADCLWTDEIAGSVSARAAAETGLSPGTPVTVGTADAAAEAYSVGVSESGDMLLMYGSSIFIIHVADRLRMDSRLWAGPYLFPGTYAVTAGMSCAGTLTRWFRDEIAPDVAERARTAGENPYAALAAAARDVPAGSNGLIVLPYFSGERTPINDPNAKGVIFGLTLTHTRAQIYQACLEGVGCGIAQHFDVFREMGLETKRVLAVGGGTKNEKWLKIVSDIAGREQLLPRISVGAAYGDALLAARGAGLDALRDAANPAQGIHSSVRPDPANTARYAPYRKKYEKLYLATRELMGEDDAL